MNGKRVNVTPVRPVEHRNYSDLIGIRGHRNYYVNMLSGRITYKSRGTVIRTQATTISEARRIVDEQLAARSSGKPISVFRREKRGVVNPSISEIWQELMELKRVEVSARTMVTYRNSWDYGFGPFWKTKHVQEIHQHNMEAFKVWYLINNSTRFAEKTLVHLGMLFRYMHRMGYISALPDMKTLSSLQETIDRNSKRERVGRVVKDDELGRILEATQSLYERPFKDFSGNRKVLAHRAKLGILLAARAGFRKMEALALEWDRVDLQSGVIRMWSTKNMKWREVPIVPELVEALKIQRDLTEGSRWVFPMPSDKARHISSQVFDKVWEQCKQRAGIKGRLRFHDLRHTFATKTAEAGWPVVVACEVLDMSLRIYQRVYCKPSFDSKAEWVMRTFKI